MREFGSAYSIGWALKWMKSWLTLDFNLSRDPELIDPCLNLWHTATLRYVLFMVLSSGVMLCSNERAIHIVPLWLLTYSFLFKCCLRCRFAPMCQLLNPGALGCSDQQYVLHAHLCSYGDRQDVLENHIELGKGISQTEKQPDRE